MEVFFMEADQYQYQYIHPGLLKYRIIGDEDSLYRAVAYGLWGSENVDYLRQIVQHNWHEYPEKYKGFPTLGEGQSLSEYMKKICVRECAVFPEVTMLETLLNYDKTIVVIDENGVIRHENSLKRKPIFIYTKDHGHHYDALVVREGYDAWQIWKEDPNHIPCQLGVECDKPICPFWHDPASLPCPLGVKCRNTNCPYWHPPERTLRPCKFGMTCKKSDCPFWHPPERPVPTPLSEIPCKFWAECQSSSCPYKHPSEEEKERILWNIKREKEEREQRRENAKAHCDYLKAERAVQAMCPKHEWVRAYKHKGDLICSKCGAPYPRASNPRSEWWD